MGSIFGGGGGGGVTYVPAVTSVQATKTDSVDANKAMDDAVSKQKQLLAANSNTANNIATSSLGVTGTANTQNKTLLGQ